MSRSLRTFLLSGAISLVLLSVSGCATSVQEGPTAAPSSGSGSRPTMIGKETAPTPIPQKQTSADQSSLAHPAPDQRIDKP